MIEHQVAALADAGVTDIVLAVNYRPEVMTKHLKKVPPRRCEIVPDRPSRSTRSSSAST
jgi:NDP-sugar pyrophosphorylase family protein